MNIRKVEESPEVEGVEAGPKREASSPTPRVAHRVEASEQECFDPMCVHDVLWR